MIYGIVCGGGGDSMIYITGDTHRNFSRVVSLYNQSKTSISDLLIILGDAGINGFGKEGDRQIKQFLNRIPITLFCIHGNHEERPQNISGFAPDWLDKSGARSENVNRRLTVSVIGADLKARIVLRYIVSNQKINDVIGKRQQPYQFWERPLFPELRKQIRG
jgi:hypothetical protein